MGFFNHSQDGKRIAIFHVGSGSVYAGFVELKTKDKTLIPEILFSTSAEMTVTDNLDFALFEKTMGKTLEKVAFAMQKAHLGEPDEILCFVGSPWYAAQARTVRLEKNISFIVTEKLVEELVKKEIDAFEKEELLKYKEVGSTAQIIEREITRIALNGYPVTDAYGQKTTSIDFSLMVSMSPAVVIEKIVNAITTSYFNKKIRFHSFAYAGTLAVRDLFISKDNFLFVDIGGEITDIALVKNGMVTDTVSFPFGKNVLLRKFAVGMEKSIPDARSLLALYRDNKLEATIQIKSKKIIGAIMEDWKKLFQNTISQLATEFLLPDTIALITTPDTYTFFNEAISSDAFNQFTLTEKPFTIIPIVNQALVPFIRVKAEIPLNAFIAVESIVAARKNI